MKCKCGNLMDEIELAPDHWWCTNCGTLAWATDICVERSYTGTVRRTYNEDSISWIHPATYRYAIECTCDDDIKKYIEKW